MQAIKSRMDKQEGPTVEDRELYSLSGDKPQWKRVGKRTDICITEPLCIQQKLMQLCQSTILQ